MTTESERRRIDDAAGLPSVDSLDEQPVKYPEHEKQKAIVEQSQAIGEFLDLGPGQLCELVDSGKVTGWGDTSRPVMEWQPVSSIQQVLADYFKIDLDKIEAEKRQMLAELQAANS